MEAPKIPSMFGFKSKKPNRFYFEPRFYDERKEKFQERYDSITREVNKIPVDEKNSSEAFKTNLRASWGEGYSRNRVGGAMNKRVLIYVVALAVLAYIILF